MGSSAQGNNEGGQTLDLGGYLHRTMYVTILMKREMAPLNHAHSTLHTDHCGSVHRYVPVDSGS